MHRPRRMVKWLALFPTVLTHSGHRQLDEHKPFIICAMLYHKTEVIVYSCVAINWC